jgi:hypothetical protein
MLIFPALDKALSGFSAFCGRRVPTTLLATADEVIEGPLLARNL